MNKTENKHLEVLLLAWGTILIWALTYIFTKIGLLYYSAFSLSAFRYLSAGAVTLVTVVIRREKLPAARDIPLFFLTGGAGFVLYVVALNNGMETVSVSASSVIISTSPIMVALLGSILFHEHLGKFQMVAIAVEFIGVLIVCLWNGNVYAGRGILLIVAAMFCFTGYNLLTRLLVKRYSPYQITEYSMISAAVLYLFFLPKTVKGIFEWNRSGVISVLFLGIFGSVIAYAMWNRALNLADKTSEVTNAMFLTPLLSSIMSFIMLKEIPGVGTILGGGIIIFGLILFTKGTKREDTNAKGSRERTGSVSKENQRYGLRKHSGRILFR